MPSILAAIGGVIERHMVATGFLQGEGMGLKSDPQARALLAHKSAGQNGADDDDARARERPRGPACPSCGQYGLMMVEGCQTCPNCGYSECG